MPNKKIRLDSQFSTVCAAWPPDATDEVLTGTLTVDERNITFTTAPKYTRNPSEARSLPGTSSGQSVPARLPVLHGFTEKGSCSICQLTEISHPGLRDYESKQFIGSTAYRAMALVMGMHLGGVEDKCLSSARYTFSGISEWLPGAASESWEKDFIVVKVPLHERDIVSFGLRESHIQVNLKVFPELTDNESDGGRVSRSVPLVEIESPGNESLSWYRDIGNRLENLFSLLTGTSVAVETIFVYGAGCNGHIIEKRESHAKRFDPFQCVRWPARQLASAIAIWLCAPRKFRSVESLALGVARKGKLLVETEFLSLAQALEGFHRVTSLRSTPSDKTAFRQVRKKIAKLLQEENVNEPLAKSICESMSHVNDLTFTSRLTELCNRIDGPLLTRMEIDPEQFVDNVVTTRNFYTHAGSGLRTRPKRTPVEGSQLFLLSKTMRALLRGVMLLHLEFTEAQFGELLVRDVTRWH